MNRVNPPKWADRFLRWYCNTTYLEEIEGDIYELFDRRAENKGAKHARAKFVWDVFRFFRWSNVKKSNSKYSKMNRASLFRNYLKLGFRSIRKNLVTSSINIFGLAAAVAITITTFIFVDLQLNMDRFHTNGARIYQLTNNVEKEDQGLRWGNSPILLGPQIAADNPAIESYARIERKSAAVKFKADVFDEVVSFVDPSYLEMLDFPILAGPESALSQKNQIVISKDMAIKYFSDTDPMGQELSFKFYNGTLKRFTVGAVLDEFPYNAGLRDDFLISMEVFFDLDFKANYNWSDNVDATLVMLKEGESVDAISDSFDPYIELQHGSNPEWKIAEFNPISLYELSVTAYQTRRALVGGGHPSGRIVLIFISAFLLGMACFNFMNISVASSTKRLKEIALRKVMGGRRKQIINQFLVENTLQCCFALIFGSLLAYFLFVPGFDFMIPEMDIQFRTNSPSSMILFFVCLLVGVGVISGAYPALYVARFEPITIFRGSQKFGSKTTFSKIMLGVQFFLAILTVVGCFVFADQSLHLTSKDWGYDPAGTLSVWVESEEQYEKLRNEMITHPDVASYGASSNQIGRYLPLKPLEFDGKEFSTRILGASGNYGETMQLRLKEGRFLTDNVSDQNSAVVVNEKFVKAMGWDDDAINKTFVLDSARKTVVGVVEDFHFFGFYSPIDPLIMQGLTPSAVHYLTVRTKTDDLFRLDEHARASWKKIAPNDPFDRLFQADAMEDFYRESKANITVILVISSIAILLACLGLYGLLSFNIQGKLKEFSVRKVLGATPKTLVKIASSQYSWIILIAFIVGAPLGFLGMQQVINSIFPDPKGVSALPFIVAMLLLTVTMAITVAGQIKRAIEVNPADVLRNE